MFSLLGGLIVLMALLLQRGYRCLQVVVGVTPVDLDEQTIAILRSGNSLNSIGPAYAAHRLAIGPPWDRVARLFGIPVRSVQLVTVSIPSRRFIRG